MEWKEGIKKDEGEGKGGKGRGKERKGGHKKMV